MSTRTLNTLLETGSYGSSLKGSSGVTKPFGTGRGALMPGTLDPGIEKDRIESMQRRRQRLRELSLGWARPGEAGDGNKETLGEKPGSDDKKKSKDKKKKKDKKSSSD